MSLVRVALVAFAVLACAFAPATVLAAQGSQGDPPSGKPTRVAEQAADVDAVPVVARAPATHRPATHGKGKAKGHAKPAAFVLKGTVVSVDADSGAVTVKVTGGNRLGRRFLGVEQAVDLSSAKVLVDDADADAADLDVGDLVVVTARLPRDTRPGRPLAARRLVDQTAHVEADNADETGDTSDTSSTDGDPGTTDGTDAGY